MSSDFPCPNDAATILLKTYRFTLRHFLQVLHKTVFFGVVLQNFLGAHFDIKFVGEGSKGMVLSNYRSNSGQIGSKKAEK